MHAFSGQELVGSAFEIPVLDGLFLRAFPVAELGREPAQRTSPVTYDAGSNKELQKQDGKRGLHGPVNDVPGKGHECQMMPVPRCGLLTRGPGAVHLSG